MRAPATPKNREAPVFVESPIVSTAKLTDRPVAEADAARIEARCDRPVPTWLARFASARAVAVIALFTSAATVGCAPAPSSGDGGTAMRGGGARQPSSAQQSGSSARGAMSSANSQGAMQNGLACGGALEGAGVCASETQLLFCLGETWWLLDCAALSAGGYCAYDSSLSSVDCYTSP
jgi:hypothetical protein